MRTLLSYITSMPGCFPACRSGLRGWGLVGSALLGAAGEAAARGGGCRKLGWLPN